MTQNRTRAVAAVVGAAFAMSGCYVESTNLPDAPQFLDDRLVGTWQGVDDNKPVDVYVHFQQLEGQNALRVIWVDNSRSDADDGFAVYELTTMRVGNKHVFAATGLQAGQEAEEHGKSGCYVLGFYEVKGSEAAFYLLERDKIEAPISRGVVKAVEPPNRYDFVSLTGSPTELAGFLASPDAEGARTTDVLRVRRLAARPDK
jgi:hypothetical protein